MAGHPTLPNELLAEFAGFGQTRSIPKNTIVVREGEPAESLFLILEGSLSVFIADEHGREVELNVLGAREYFGELMLGSSTRTASVKSLTPARLSMIRRAEFEQILAARPDIAFHVIQTLIYRIRVLTRNVQSLALMDVYGRVARLFLENAVDAGGRQVVPGMSQEKIAIRVGASRSMINRIMKDLSEGGYIAVSRKEIVLQRDLPKRW